MHVDAIMHNYAHTLRDLKLTPYIFLSHFISYYTIRFVVGILVPKCFGKVACNTRTYASKVELNACSFGTFGTFGTLCELL